MGKHRQNKSLGSVTSFASSENAQQTQQTPDERINALETRVATLETLLNDVMLQLDKPFKASPNLKKKKRHKSATAPQPEKKSEIDPSPQAKTEFHNQKQKRASEAALAASLERLKTLFGDGVKRTESEIFQQLRNLSKRHFRRLRSYLQNDANEDYDARLYWMEDTEREK